MLNQRWEEMDSVFVCEGGAVWPGTGLFPSFFSRSWSGFQQLDNSSTQEKILNAIAGFCCDNILRFSVELLHLVCVPPKMP